MASYRGYESHTAFNPKSLPALVVEPPDDDDRQRIRGIFTSGGLTKQLRAELKLVAVIILTVAIGQALVRRARS